MKLYVVTVAAFLAAACSSATTPDRGAPVPAAGSGSTTNSAGDDDNTQTATGGDDDDDTGDAAAPDGGTNPPVDTDGGALDWQGLYTLYFAPETVGHCANCHSGGLAGFTTGTTADSMYQGLVAAKLLDATNPSASPLGTPGKSPLAWYNVPQAGHTTLAGLMPQDGANADPAAAAAVTAWVVSGAPNHGVGPGGQMIADAGAPDASMPPSDAGMNDAGAHDAGGDAGPASGTFSDVYENWLGPSTPGHCSDTYCHNLSTSKGSKASGFVCGSTKTDCFNGLVKAGLVNTATPGSSVLGTPASTPLSWYGQGGGMPADEAMTNAAGAAAITAWINAGAQDD